VKKDTNQKERGEKMRQKMKNEKRISTSLTRRRGEKKTTNEEKV